MAPQDEFIMTMDSDDELSLPLPPRTSTSAKGSKSEIPEEAQLNPEFSFDLAGDPYADFLVDSQVQDLVKQGTRPVCMSR